MTSDSTAPTESRDASHARSDTFCTTRWTQVNRAKVDSPEGRRALAELCAAYYEPVAAFLRCQVRDPDAARDLAHEFFAEVLAGNAIAHAQPERGRFRSYLLGAVKHFLSHQLQAARRLKRGGGRDSVSLNDTREMEARSVPDAAFSHPTRPSTGNGR